MLSFDQECQKIRHFKTRTATTKPFLTAFLSDLTHSFFPDDIYYIGKLKKYASMALKIGNFNNFNLNSKPKTYERRKI